MENNGPMSLELDKKVTLEPGAIISTGAPLWRLQLIRCLQLLGVLMGFIGGADFLQLLAIVPADVSKWLVVAGPAFAASVKPFIMFVGDYLDDGKIDGSFKLPNLVLLAILIFTLAGIFTVLPSCTLSVAPDGTRTYSADPGAVMVLSKAAAESILSQQPNPVQADK